MPFSLEGMRLPAYTALLLVIFIGTGLLVAADTTEALRLTIRGTARISLLLFLTAFTASALHRLLPGRMSGFLLRNRRHFGLSFALSHFVHLTAIILLTQQDPELFWKLTNVGNIITGGSAYLFIVAMTLTSFDTMARRIGTKVWHALHTTGAWYIWLSFGVAFGKRAAMNPYYWPAVALIIAALAIKIAARLRRPASPA